MHELARSTVASPGPAASPALRPATREALQFVLGAFEIFSKALHFVVQPVDVVTDSPDVPPKHSRVI
jgi:hypothetical protein